MALPYADAVANLKAGGLTGSAYDMALSSLNNAYGVGTPTGPNAGAAAAEPVSTAIPTTSPNGAQTYTTPATQSALSSSGITPYTQTAPAIPPPASSSSSAPGGPTVGQVIKGGAANSAGDISYQASYQGGGQWQLTDTLGRSYGTVSGDMLAQRGFTNVPTAPQASAPTTTTIGNPVTPPTNTGAFSLPQGTAASTVATYQTGLQAQLDAQTKQLASAYQQQVTAYQQKIDALNAQNDQYKQLESAGLSAEGSVVQQETAAKQAALDQEKAQFQAAYDAKTALINEMNGLLTTGNQIVSDMKATTGLSSIMTPRISQTMADVTARAGVITALLSAQDGQIGVAQNQLKASTDALTSIYGDQINYYQNVISFYDNQQKINDAQVSSLSSDQKTYIDAQLGLLKTQMDNTQKNVDMISTAMLDPNKALAYASAGVSLNDSPQQINQKLATYQYSQELADTSTKMSAAGYSEQPIHGVTPVTITDSQGKVTLWYNTKAAAPKVFGSANGGYYSIDASGNVNPVTGGSGTGGGGGGTFSTTQINKGANNAGLATTDFTKLSADVKNYYVNLTPSNLKAINTVFSDVQSGAQTPAQAKALINSSNATANVKSYLTNKVDSLAPTSSSGGGVVQSVSDFFGNMWKSITGQ